MKMKHLFGKRASLVLFALVASFGSTMMPFANAFVSTSSSPPRISSASSSVPSQRVSFRVSRHFNTLLYAAAYVPQKEGQQQQPSPEDSGSKTTVLTKAKKSLHPKVGDIVRYYDLDGGRRDGQVLVGRITYIQKELKSLSKSGWLVELAELENVGDGYFAEYPARKKRSKVALRNLEYVSPIAASFVQSENAWKIPRQKGDLLPAVRAEEYDWQDYPGPFAESSSINLDVVQTDAVVYNNLKGKVFRYVALTGLAGIVVADLLKGTEDAVIYAAGVVSSLAYLFLLSVKTDTMAAPDSKFGNNIANLRFFMPLFVLLGVALYNQSLGDANPLAGRQGSLEWVTAEQFAAAILGFLTYRLPLLVIQIQDAFKGENNELTLPGSAGVALQLAKSAADEKQNEASSSSLMDTNLATILLVSGPQATGRTALVKRLIAEGQGRFVEPTPFDRVKDPATFERLEQREEFLVQTKNNRYGWTKDSLLASARQAAANQSLVVVDANVALAKQLTAISGLRIVGVWVGLSSVEQFEQRLNAMLDAGEIAVSQDDNDDETITRETVIRSRIREIVKEIEYGISSGIFEFTILNENEDVSLKQLQDAASYCFK